jgi:hypothetical protein
LGQEQLAEDGLFLTVPGSVPAHQNDFHVRPSPEEPFQVAGGGDSPETAADDQNAFLRY